MRARVAFRADPSPIPLQEKILSDIRCDDKVDQSIFDRSIEIEENKNLLARLHAREAMEFGIDSKNSLCHFAYSVLRSIQSIRFAFEWADLGKDVKTQFRADAFEKFNPKFVASNPTRAEYKREFNIFKNRHQRVIKSRNEIRDLFLAVSKALL